MKFSKPKLTTVTLVVALLVVGMDDWRRAAAPAPTAASAAVATAPTSKGHGTTRVVTELKCPDGTKWTQTSTQHDSTTVSAPVTVGATATPTPRASPYDPPRYSASADTNPLRPRDVGVSISARVGNLPLSIVIGGELHSGIPEPRVGIRVDL